MSEQTLPRSGAGPGPDRLPARISRSARHVPLVAFVLCLVATGVGLAGGDAVHAALAPPPLLSTWATVFVSVVLQSLPFLVLGITLSALVAVVLPMDRLLALLPARQGLAVPVAGLAGVVLPGCECASVPVASSLMRRGLGQAPALAFLLAAPAVNPVVLVSTAVAFPGRPDVVLARFAASLLVATAMGWLWLRIGRPDLIARPRQHGAGSAPRGLDGVVATMSHDLVHVGGLVVVGAALAASVNVLLPTEWLAAVAGREWLAVLALGLLAVAVAICSEADAFVAASFTQFSTTAKLVFMVVGPMVDVKLMTLQAGVFGRSFALRFGPATFVVAVVTASAVGWWLR